MTATTEEKYSNPLPRVRRLITTSNAEGQSVFAPDLAEEMEFWRLKTPQNIPVGFFLGYMTNSSPAPLKDHEDLRQYKKRFSKSEQSGLVSHGGTVLRYVDIPPQDKSTMHRTVSLDYGILIEGELECLLDSGESRILRPGDVVVQRGTMHQWINHSDTTWARIAFILIHATPLEFNGKQLDEDLGGLTGVPRSH
ncbi:hypothetical protein BGZ63DRAFT_408516 [Mariannaea sp. PMI_226]|nr:hypothetical protein BGZ63DRAFT_408516 [Mariannaea sp. PMI_226]